MFPTSRADQGPTPALGHAPSRAAARDPRARARLKIAGGTADAAQGMAEARILLVDDDPLVRNAVGEVLERAGYAVETHDSGFGLAQAIREHRPDLVLLDVSMPGLRGDAALRAAQSLSHAMPAVTVALFSGLPADELADRAHELGIHAIPKPISPRALVANIERLLQPTQATA